MEFKLILTPKTPDTFLLYAETPLSGLEFVEKAGACLRRNLDTETRARHITLGNVAQYEISVPQAIAIESGWFKTSNTRYLPCEPGILSKYIFYGASMNRAASNRPVYPYYSNEVVLVSYIDELALLEIWRNRGYPGYFVKDFETMPDIPMVPDAEDVDNPTEGDMVLDDLMQGLH